ncbi:MAG: flagellar hook-basal body complex protein FliE [Melioribacteraceae bacterium]|nr:flagellar hook-basal body complex protein FliE [Melioribacteraceae bacterium]MCF8353736.1 flagellar hook-basal body complex protein FliE [Melioribacteraceae bacterium]MCF8392455.1 flagellar hook-basal body complex protein FliE [Melioribacteraceae bacterium]MCF8418366.1 flagellar hook-basal body complex protein FliE [Melioribacteraceae bacterium]
MKIDSSINISKFLPKDKPHESRKTDGFGELVGGFIEQVKSEQQNSVSKMNEFITGGDVEIHEVMIAGEKAKTSLDLLIELRNKTLDMYKEITRMQ